MTNQDMELNYLNAVLARRRPSYVPSRVRLLSTIRGDFPSHDTVAPAGDYDCQSNIWGAISVTATNGRMLGIKPDERIVLEWKYNTGTDPRL